MNFGSEIIVIPAIFIGLPWLILHYVTRWKTAATLTNDDERMLGDMHELARRLEDRLDTVERLVAQETAVSTTADLSTTAVFFHRYQSWQSERQIKTAVSALNREEQNRLKEIERALRQQQRLVRQIQSLQTVRKMMGWWHTAHVPLGLTLFTSMTIHIIATIYYGALS